MFQFSRLIEDITTSLDNLYTSLISAESLCTKIVHFVNNDENNLTTKLNDSLLIHNNFSSETDDQNSSWTINTEDLGRLEDSFQILRRKEIDLDFKKCRSKVIHDLENDLLKQCGPSPDSFQ